MIRRCFLLSALCFALISDRASTAEPVDYVRDVKPILNKHCASCHGTQLQGDPAKGAPRLDDSVWLYGDGSIYNIENTILYGIRSGHPRSHRFKDMPALGRTQQLAPALWFVNDRPKVWRSSRTRVFDSGADRQSIEWGKPGSKEAVQNEADHCDCEAGHR